MKFICISTKEEYLLEENYSCFGVGKSIIKKGTITHPDLSLGKIYLGQMVSMPRNYKDEENKLYNGSMAAFIYDDLNEWHHYHIELFRPIE